MHHLCLTISRDAQAGTDMCAAHLGVEQSKTHSRGCVSVEFRYSDLIKRAGQCGTLDMWTLYSSKCTVSQANKGTND